MKFFKTKKYSILSNILKYSFVIVFAVMLTAPIVFADPTTGTAGVNNIGNNSAGVDNTGTNIKTTINNPLGENGPQNIPDFIKVVINIVLVVGVPIVTLAIIYTGFLFVQAQGNPEKLTKAKSALMYTLIGAALLLGAFVIAEAIVKTVDDIKSTT